MAENAFEDVVDKRLPLLQDADLYDKVVLLRVDHNVIKHGAIMDQYRVDCTLATMYNIIERGGRPIIMTHVGRPRDKKTGKIAIDSETSVDAIVTYLQRKLRIRFAVPHFHPSCDGTGISDVDTSINHLIGDLKARRVGGIYLPNTRWFTGEEDKGDKCGRFAVQLAGLADVFVNDAFGSWQAHASTSAITRVLPSFAGLLMQDELSHVRELLNPRAPFLAVVGGGKYDTKIGPLNEIYKKVDYLILGGVVYNAFLCAKYGVKIRGVSDSDVELAKGLVDQDAVQGKLLELNFLVESDTIEGKEEGQYRIVRVDEFRAGQELAYILDADPSSFEQPAVKAAIAGASTIFVNAVMGLTPHFSEGTAKLDLVIDQNKSALKFYGGGDTLHELKILLPGLYHAAIDSAKYYLFTGGGTVLKVIEEGDPYDLAPIKALMDNAVRFGTPTRAVVEKSKLEGGGCAIPPPPALPENSEYSLFTRSRSSQGHFVRQDSGFRSTDPI